MVHLGPLPGSPRFAGDLDAVLDAAIADAATLAAAGFDAIGVENFGDAPFFADDVPKVTVAAMTAAVGAVMAASGLPVAVNVLRNDALGALAVAAATGAPFIRVNVLSGSMWTDQGLIHGRAADVARLRAAICPDTAVLADVFVKHALPVPGALLADAVEEVVGRGLADAVVVSGTATGRPPTMDDLVTAAAAGAPVYVGSGATHDDIAAFLTVAHGVLVGTSIKIDGVTTNPVDPDRASRFAAAVRR
jgi:membrane complex biogenesis BtpA family protein